MAFDVSAFDSASWSPDALDGITAAGSYGGGYWVGWAAGSWGASWGDVGQSGVTWRRILDLDTFEMVNVSQCIGLYDMSDRVILRPHNSQSNMWIDVGNGDVVHVAVNYVVGM